MEFLHSLSADMNVLNLLPHPKHPPQSSHMLESASNLYIPFLLRFNIESKFSYIIVYPPV